MNRVGLRMAGLIACQRDAYLKSFNSKVLQCQPLSKNDVKKAKLPTAVTHAVQVEDSILFCEGGGQPSDTGLLNSVPVLYVGRDANKNIQHYTSGPLNVGDEVDIKLNWERRYDHMQQHTGQHLLSAVAEKEFGWETTSWWLGETYCNVELAEKDPEKPINAENIQKLETQVNDLIKTSSKVIMKVVEAEGDEEEEKNDSNETEEDKKDRKSKARHHGATRVIVIENVDENQCCGTHISQLSELQMIKLLKTEKTRGQTRLFFIVGDRVLKYLRDVFQRETTLNTLLCASPENYVELITKMQSENKNLQKIKKKLTEDIIAEEAKHLAATGRENENVIYFHKKEVDIAYLTTLASSLSQIDPNFHCLLTCENSGDSSFLIQSSTNINTIGKEIAAIFKGRGGGSGGRFQGKITDLSASDAAYELFKSKLVSSA